MCLRFKRHYQLFVLLLLICALPVPWLVACVVAPTQISPTGEQAERGAAETDVADSSASSQITLHGDSISVDGGGAVVDGCKVTITTAGAYSIRGSLTDGQIIVDTKDQALVKLVFNGVDVSSSTSAPICVMDAGKVVIVLAGGTENRVVDTASYVLADAAGDEPNAAIFSKADLTISGNGTLSVTGNYNDGIAGKDGLTIAGGTITVNAVDDGIRGKDYLLVQDGDIAVKAQGDGLKADNTEDAAKGYVSIEGGSLAITSGGDAIAAQTQVTISGGRIVLTSGGGSNGHIEETASAKGIKGLVGVKFDGGILTIDSADDAIHANGSVVINGGEFVISSGDDGIHADSSIELNNGRLNIIKCYEGLESAKITINEGEIHVASSDDGLNVAAGNDGSGMQPGPGRAGGRGQGVGQDLFASAGDNYLHINGGYVVVDAFGDGVDINGSAEMTGGTLIVNGPVENMNGALDYYSFWKMSGGFLVAVGSAGMAQAPSESSSQYSLLLNLEARQAADTLVHIEDSDGEDILTFAPTKEYQSIAFSSAELANGGTYVVYCGGSVAGTSEDGLYRGGVYTPGVEYTRFTITRMVTMLGGRFR